MKKEILRKITLPIGVVALATLPFVSVVSCSNNDSSGSNNGGGSVIPPQPEDKIPYLEGTWNIKPTKYEKDGYRTGSFELFYESNLREIQRKIANNEVKVKNEDGSYVKYEMTITLNPGVTFASDDNVNPNQEYNSDTNQFKVLNKDKLITTSFEIDFDSTREDIVEFLDFKNTIAVTNFNVTNNDKDVRVQSLSFVFDTKTCKVYLTTSEHKGPEIYIENKSLFSRIDTPELKYADWTNREEGERGKLFTLQLMGRVTNLSGTISIKPIKF